MKITFTKCVRFNDQSVEKTVSIDDDSYSTEPQTIKQQNEFAIARLRMIQDAIEERAGMSIEEMQRSA
jgi:hypothetical protein